MSDYLIRYTAILATWHICGDLWASLFVVTIFVAAMFSERKSRERV